MNRSITTANFNTHLKVVVISLVAALIIAAIGITAHFNNATTEAAYRKTDRALVGRPDSGVTCGAQQDDIAAGVAPHEYVSFNNATTLAALVKQKPV